MLKVSGRKPRQDKSQDQDDPLFCGPCDKDGRKLEARGYCTDCGHYLCQKCYDAHTIPLPSRKHSLLDAESMPTSISAQGMLKACIGTITCLMHKNKVVDIYCVSHDMAVCGACAFKEHTSCKTEDIGDAAKSLDLHQRFTELEQLVFSLRKNLATIHEDTDTSIKTTETSSDIAARELKKFRAKLMAHLEQVEEQLLASGDLEKARDVQEMKEKKEDCEFKDLELTNHLALLKKHELNNNDLYVTLRQTETLLERLQHEIPALTKKNRTVSYNFQPDKILKRFLENNGQLGLVKRKESTNSKKENSSSPKKNPKVKIANLHDKAIKRWSGRLTSTEKMSLASAVLLPMSDIHMKYLTEERECHISGMALLSPSTLLVIDHNNKSVKCMDTLKLAITSCLKLPDSPWDVTILPKNEAAITLPWKQQIQVILTRGDIRFDRTINVQGSCHGICSTSDRLFVSYIQLLDDPAKIEIMDHQGIVLHTLCTDVDQQKMLINPYYLITAKENEQDMIYVSDYTKSAVYKLTTAGKIIFMFKDWSMLCPTGIAITRNGELLVSSWSKQSLQLVSKQGTKIKALLETGDTKRQARGDNQKQAVSASDDKKKPNVLAQDNTQQATIDARNKHGQLASLCLFSGENMICVSQVLSDTMQVYDIC